MTSPAKALANKMNAKASTGPVTPEGKAASSRNATSHGLATTYFAILPGEDPQAYADTLDQYTATFRPRDCHELHLLEIMVQSKWKLFRIQLMETALVTKMMEADPTHQSPAQAVAAALFDGTAGPYKTLLRYQAAAERSYNNAMKQLLAYRSQTPPPTAQPENASKPNEPKSAAAAPAKQYFGPHCRVKKFERPRRPGCPNFEKLLRAHRIAA